MMYVLLAVLVTSLVGVGLLAYSYRRSEKSFDSAGVRLHYWDEGAGTPVILLHGFAADSFINWRVPGVVRALKKHFRVISLDIRGHGRSEKPTDPNAYGLELVEDVRRLMDHIGIEKAHLVGYSMGGFITLAFTIHYPERLLSACAGGAGWLQEHEYPEILQTLPASLDAGAGYLPILNFFEPNLGRIGKMRLKVADRAIKFYNPNASCMARCFESLVRLRDRDIDFAANQVPVFAFAGTRDPLRRAVENLSDRGDLFKTMLIEGGDHTTTLAWRPFRMRCVRAMTEFLLTYTPRTS